MLQKNHLGNYKDSLPLPLPLGHSELQHLVLVGDWIDCRSNFYSTSQAVTVLIKFRSSCVLPKTVQI